MEGYPKTKYPASGGGSITVDSPEQEKTLGPGWQDHPPFPPVSAVQEDPDLPKRAKPMKVI